METINTGFAKYKWPFVTGSLLMAVGVCLWVLAFVVFRNGNILPFTLAFVGLSTTVIGLITNLVAADMAIS